MRVATTAVLAGMLVISLAHAGDVPALKSDKSACMEGSIAQFGRYIGDWKIEDEAFARDGSGWNPGNGARWIFSCVGPGVAIQDFWMPNNGGFGTNLRTYNPDTESWEIVWAAVSVDGMNHISAKQNDEGDIVMEFVTPVQDPPRRIIFFAPDENGWRWSQQWSFDGGETWVDVYRMKATVWRE